MFMSYKKISSHRDAQIHQHALNHNLSRTINHRDMSRDILSMIGKSKSSTVTKAVSSQAKSTISDLITSKASTHTTSIIDSYLIKIIPKSPIIPENPTPIASFDLDGTLVHTKSGSKFARTAQDWRWFNSTTVKKLQSLEIPIVIFTNQGGVVATKTSKSYNNFQNRVELILKELGNQGIDVRNIWIYASPKKPASYKGNNVEQFDKMRKPNIGMFEQFQKDFGNDEVNLEESYFIGDAAGRKNDFSDSDFKFAQNCKLQFKTPEEYFI